TPSAWPRPLMPVDACWASWRPALTSGNAIATPATRTSPTTSIIARVSPRSRTRNISASCRPHASTVRTHHRRPGGRTERIDGSEVEYGTGKRARDAVDALNRKDDGPRKIVQVRRLGSRDHVVGARDAVDGHDALDTSDLRGDLGRPADLGLDEHVRADHHGPS